VAPHLVDDDEGAGRLVPGEVTTAPLAQLRATRRRGAVELHDRHDLLPEPLVRTAGDERVDHRVVLLQDVFHLFDEDLLAARVHHQ
jgi:hypothetical protein